MSKNPILQKKYDEGFHKGFEAGRSFERKVALEFFAQQFHNLRNVDGFGEKTIEKFKEHFGEKYFNE